MFSIQNLEKKMEKLGVQSNHSESDISQSDSLFETKNIKPQRNRRKSCASWCVPRKTKAVSSTGEIFIDLTSASNVKKKKSRNRTKAHKIREKAFQSQQRINELSQPRKKVFRSPKDINELLLPKRVIFESSHKSQNNKDSDLKSTSSLSLTNFGINESNTNSESISKQVWMERINKLAEPRIREPNPSNVIRKVTEKALKAIASKRIQELAKRKRSKLVDAQKKDRDPYKVSPQALKAICSTRTKSLATPRIFQLHSHHCSIEKVNS